LQGYRRGNQLAVDSVMKEQCLGDNLRHDVRNPSQQTRKVTVQRGSEIQADTGV
jgi:hypothetical protein